MIKTTRPMTADDIAAYAATLSDDSLRNLIRHHRRTYRLACSATLRNRSLERHAIFMTEFRARNLARAATTP